MSATAEIWRRGANGGQERQPRNSGAARVTYLNGAAMALAFAGGGEEMAQRRWVAGDR